MRWILIGLALTGMVMLCSCSGMGILQNPAQDLSQQRFIMEQQNARGCIYFTGNAQPWANVKTIIVGTWGQDPPSYQDCWKGVPTGF